MWMMMPSDVDPTALPTSHPRQTMMTIFFGVNGIIFIDILPEKAKLSSEYFRKNIIKELDLIVYATKRKSHITCIYLHFDNALVNNTQMIRQTMTECNLHNFDHRAYSPDLILCGFFFFGYLYNIMVSSMCRMTGELEEKIRVIVQAISKSQLIAVF
jgi:hypothetical protein